MDVVADSTDPATLRPNLAPIEDFGDAFRPIFIPKYDYYINLPADAQATSAITIFQLYWSPKILEKIVYYTNQNEYGPGKPKPRHSREWDWKETSLSELYVYLGIRIYMGLHRENRVRDYWSHRPGMPEHLEIQQAMSLRRFEALHSRLCVFQPGISGHAHELIKPLDTHIQTISLQLWTPGRDLAVDECMVRYEGNCPDTLTIPSKPIPTGFKIWAIADQGYLLAWFHHRPGSIKACGPQGVLVPPELKGNKTAAVVPALVEKLPGHYYLYLDNLFTSSKLAKYLLQLEHGITGTCRPNSGIPQEFILKKSTEKKKDTYSWGTLFSVPSESENINYIAWKDNALVLFQSTIDDAIDTVSRQRKRPKKTSTSAKTARAPFGNQSRKILPIPKVVDDYNHNMGAVDRADQLRSYNTIFRAVRQEPWHALFNFLLDVSLVNSFLLSDYKGRTAKFRSPAEFRIALTHDLLKLSGPKIRKRTVSKRTIPNRAVPYAKHILQNRHRLQVCKHCQVAEPKQKKRRVLGEVSSNCSSKDSTNGSSRRTVYGCITYDVALCKEGNCFANWHQES